MGNFLIYGATGGIGSALVRALAADGHALRIVARDEGRLAALAHETGATASPCDVTDEADLEELSGALAETSLDGLVFAVGTITLKPFAKLTVGDFESDFRVNALAAARAVQIALPGLMRPPAASIVLVSSVAARKGFAAHASISMAKAAVEGLTMALAAELAPKIRVNAVAPSLTLTPLAEPIVANETMARALARMHALARLGRPDDVAAAIRFLLTDEAGWISGQVLGVDGGRANLHTKG